MFIHIITRELFVHIQEFHVYPPHTLLNQKERKSVKLRCCSQANTHTHTQIHLNLTSDYMFMVSCEHVLPSLHHLLFQIRFLYISAQARLSIYTLGASNGTFLTAFLNYYYYFSIQKTFFKVQAPLYIQLFSLNLCNYTIYNPFLKSHILVVSRRTLSIS